jgi:hypothetical protein
MSYEDGMSAINLQMPKRVPRTEYSAQIHWDLIKAVTGKQVNQNSHVEIKQEAQKAFYKAWNYDLFWRTYIAGDELDNMRTKMGHAEYAVEGSDYSTDIVCPFQNIDEVLNFDPLNVYGRKNKDELIHRFEEDYKKACNETSDGVNMTGIYITCISGLIDIFGWDMMLTAMGTNPEKFGRLTNRYALWIQQYYDALAQTNVPVIMAHDDIVWTSGPFVRPDWYRHFVFPNYKRCFTPLIDAGKKIIFTSDGTYTMFIDDIAKTGVHGFVMEPTTDMAYVAEKYGRTHVFIGNADTRILLNGTKKQIYAEVERCMNIGKKCPGYFI